MVLISGINTAYINITGERGSSLLYKLTMKREKSSNAKVTKVILPADATLKGNNIDAIVKFPKTSVGIKVKVSDKATWDLYSDFQCTQKIPSKNLDINNQELIIFLKVVAEDGENHSIYIIKIERVR